MEYEWIIERSTEREGIWILWYVGMDHAPYFIDGGFTSYEAARWFALVEELPVYAPNLAA